MVDIVLDSEELIVLGGPSQVSVQVDLGGDGDRGSIFVVDSSEPNSITNSETNEISGITVQAFDMYINTQNKKMYQYVVGDGGALIWVEILSIIPNTYSVNKTVTFSSGEGTISDIAVTSIVDSGSTSGLTSANFNVQYSILGSSPIASSVSVSNPSGGNLPINLYATEFDGTTWSDLSGSKSVHLLITVV
jgi:hypothetical protein